MNETDYSFISKKVQQMYGLDLASYKSTQMHRRLDAYLLRVKAASWAEYFRRLDQDAAEKQRFKDYFTINVTSFFRDPDKYETLKKDILPALLKPKQTLNIWSAGCSEGAEPYSLAMLVEMVSPQQQVRILATDIDHGILAKAKAGGPYIPDSVENVPKAMLNRYFTTVGENYIVKPELRQRITFQEHNLLSQPMREMFDLIVCRNVIIYFTEEAKNKVFQRFTESLRPGGILFIGATENIAIPQTKELGLEPVRVSFYRRVDEHAEPVANSPRASLRTRI